ncbi:unnamed protein product [Bodo saltans]|uniref:AP-3 complex subunit delta n=1 Tax=Bodo saltans TaxID=75058 RepID=A0A0S4IR09_BODSA|nr:unnamed protein product [Bodo saltans]|eukprot:CUF99794.1 unnamed protein product [Bodo saltans]
MSDATKTASQILFQNSLAEVVRKIRNSKKNEQDTIKQILGEIKSEISSPALSVKVTAVVKATYFAMLGYSADYGAFNIIEVMADSHFPNKRAGYVAASLTFTEHTDVLLLATALLKRDMMSANQYEVGLALYCMSSVCTPDLAKDLVSDVVNLLNHQRAYVRKKAVLSLYKIFLQFPEALRPTYPRLKEKLEDNGDRVDNDPAVRGAVVNVFCELARRNPANFLNLAVPFFSMLSSVHNNWTLIKIIKVFGYFAPLEPRLGKKLVEPITNLITTTGAKSVQYECIFAVANGMSKVSSLTKLAADKMKFFVEDPDQNLKYLGLDAMSRIMLENPKLLSDQRDTILTCLDDSDITIRRKALELLKGMVSKKNMVSTINSMFDRCVRTPPEEEWSNLVILTIIETAQTDDYMFVQDFEWYTGVLLDLCLINLSTFKHGGVIERELVTVLTRVNAVRQFGVEALSQMLSNSNVLNCDTTRSTQWEVLKAAAFVCGEYPYWLPNKRLTCQLLLSDRVALLPAEVQVLCVGAAGKIFSYAVKPCQRHLNLTLGEEESDLPVDAVTVDDLKMALLPPDDGLLRKGLNLFCHSVFPDVQERAQFVHHHVVKAPELGPVFYETEFAAIAAGAQEAVVPPEGLDLNTPFCDNIPALVSDSEDSDDDEEEERQVAANRSEAVRRQDKQRRADVSAFYIKDDGNDRSEDLPPVVRLDSLSSPQQLRNARSAGKKVHQMSRDLSKPAAYVTTKRTKSPEEDEATRRFRSIDVTKALSAEERLPEATPYGKKRTADAEEEAKRLASSAQFDSVSLHEDKHLRIELQVVETKAKKEGLRMTFTISITNLSATSSLYDVVLNADEGQNVSVINPEESNSQVAERVRNTVTSHRDMDLVFATLPETLSEPIRFTLTCTKEKKQLSLALQFPLLLKYFATPVPATSSEEFNSKILDSLKTAVCMSAHVPLSSKQKPLLLLPRIKSLLRLCSVDTFRDTVSLYGAIASRTKHHNEQHHIAVVIRDEKVDGVSGITVLVKSHHACLAEAVIQEIAALVA